MFIRYYEWLYLIYLYIYIYIYIYIYFVQWIVFLIRQFVAEIIWNIHQRYSRQRERPRRVSHQRASLCPWLHLFSPKQARRVQSLPFRGEERRQVLRPCLRAGQRWSPGGCRVPLAVLSTGPCEAPPVVASHLLRRPPQDLLPGLRVGPCRHGAGGRNWVLGSSPGHWLVIGI